MACSPCCHSRRSSIGSFDTASSNAGWSMPSARLVARSKCSNIWHATPTALLSPTDASSRCRMAGSTFRWRDSAHHNQTKLMTLDAVEFIRRFLLHVLPTGLVKIRHFGFLANPQRREALRLCRTLLHTSEPPDPLVDAQPRVVERRCPCCGVGTLCLIGWVPAGAQLLALSLASIATADTS
jgi:Putative transposase